MNIIVIGDTSRIENVEVYQSLSSLFIFFLFFKVQLNTEYSPTINEIVYFCWNPDSCFRSGHECLIKYTRIPFKTFSIKNLYKKK